MLNIITLPWLFVGEAARIVALLQRREVDYVHIRKPGARREDMEKLVESIPQAYRNRIVLHDHFPLAEKYQLFGIHLNRRNPDVSRGWKGSVSRSCHSLEEVVRWKNRCDYVTLSPIFDSISKAGYRSAFTREEIAEAARKGIIDEKVMALGGVTFNKMKEVTAMGFGGGMILGDAWNYHRVLSIAGSDSGGGAGIQADIKTISACGCYAATAITAITIQNTLGVHDVMKIPAEIVEKQISDVLDDIGADAIKIGMLTDEAVVEAVSRQLRRHTDIPVVIDPVMVSTSGRQLIDTTAIHVMKSQLLPLATIITPNIPEAEILLDMSIKNKEDMQKAVCRLFTEYHTSVLLKGGHLEGDTLVDLFYDGTLMELSSMRIYSPNTHGTGCTLSSALASMIARKEPIDEAVRHAKDYVTRAIIAGAGYRLGRGKGSLCHLPIE